MFEKTRWVTVGVGWRDRKGDGFRLSISLGIFGEVSLTMKPNSEKRTPASPDYNIVVQADKLFLNRLLGMSTGPTSDKMSGDFDSSAPPPPEGDIPF